VYVTIELDPANLASTAAAVVEAWSSALVVTLTPSVELADVRATYDALLPLIGTPHCLAEDARIADRHSQRTGELWAEVRYDPAIPNSYRNSSNAQPLHTDGSYIPTHPNAAFMCCVASADNGGETVFISAEELVAALETERPDLLDALQQIPIPHVRGDRRIHPVIRRDGAELLLNWNYYCVAEDCEPRVAELRQHFFDYLRDSVAVRSALVPIKLMPGDAVLWKDDRLLHGRNAFVGNRPGERFLWKCAVDVGVFAR
jgi:alpha-ketoglutarate-dependent taurine dioxygenase